MTVEKDVEPVESAARMRSPTRISEINLSSPDSRVTVSEPAKQEEEEEEEGDGQDA